MKHWNRTCMIILISCSMLSVPAWSQGKPAEPVTPKASPEARALLAYFYTLSGKHFLSGQHNYPNTGERNSQFAADYIGKTPVIWSQDFGFAKDGDTDSYLARPDIMKEAIQQHEKGNIVTLCWHAVPPTAEEPITFMPLPGYDTAALASVQGQLLNKQFEDVLTPGTELHKQWLNQVDAIASFLKQLQEANVPVLWRPYHEMNGDWFWWGGRYEGKYTTVALYRQLFDRMVNHHKLNNLIWLWSVDRPSQPGREFERYYPGNDYLDMLSLDVYGNDFNQSYYDGLMKLSEGKPLVLGEVGNPPSPEILDTQPNWTYWVVWAGMVRGTSMEEYEKITSDQRFVFYEDQAYLDGTVQYRKACGFDPLEIDRSANFTGEWLMSECESQVSNAGPMGTPYKLNIQQQEDELKVISTSVVEWGDDAISEQILPLDGSDLESTTFMNAPRIQNANWSTDKDTLTIDSKVSFNFSERPVEMKTKDIWTLKQRGKKLVIHQVADSFRGGKRESIIIYIKQ